MAEPTISTPPQGFATYRRILAMPGVGSMAAASVLARLTTGMGAVALVLYVHGATGSFASAGIVAAAFTVGLGITGPLLARQIDRHGSGPVVLPGALVSSAALAAVVALGHSGAGAGALAVAAGIAGAAAPPLTGVTRQRWPQLVDARDLATTYAVDSILIEVIFIVGPLLAGVLAATVGPGDGLLAAGVLSAVGAVWFVAVASIEPSDHPDAGRHGWAGALVSPGVRILVLTGVPLGATFGALDVALPAFGTVHGSSALGGPFAAALAVGSAVGGILYGARPHSFGPPRRALLILGALQAATCLPILLAATVPEMFVGAMLGGLCVAPLITVRNQLAQVAMPPGTGTEVFTWLGLSVTCGASAGSALAGPLVEAAGWRAGVAVACVLPALAAALGWLRRDLLEPGAVRESRHGPRPADR